MAHFNEAEYGHNPDCLEYITGRKVTDDEKRKVWRELKRAERATLVSSLRSDLKALFLRVDAEQESREDALIEWLDEEDEMELVILENLKFWILQKNWSLDVQAC